MPLLGAVGDHQVTEYSLRVEAAIAEAFDAVASSDTTPPTPPSSLTANVTAGQQPTEYLYEPGVQELLASLLPRIRRRTSS